MTYCYWLRRFREGARSLSRPAASRTRKRTFLSRLQKERSPDDALNLTQ